MPLYWFTLAREGSSGPLMDLVCRNRDWMSKYELGNVNFRLTSELRESIGDELRSQNSEPTACQRGKYPCCRKVAIKMPCKMAGIAPIASVQEGIRFFTRRAVLRWRGYKGVDLCAAPSPSRDAIRGSRRAMEPVPPSPCLVRMTIYGSVSHRFPDRKSSSALE
jgi:hypothetical protein